MKIKQFKEIVGNSKVFTVTFTKKDGSERVLNGRLGVSKYVKGVGQSFDPESKGLVTVYDLKSKGYRMINVDTVKEIKANGIVYKGE